MSEEVSKNAAKKAAKAAQKEAEKAEKASKKAAEKPAADGKPKVNADDDEIDPTQYYNNRLNALTTFEVSNIYIKTKIIQIFSIFDEVLTYPYVEYIH